MAEVEVTATARLRCRDEGGRFYRLDISTTIRTDEALSNDAYIPELADSVSGQIPGNCVGVDWRDFSVIPVEAEAGGGETIRETSAFIYVYIECGGQRSGPWTQQVDIPVGTDVSEFEALAQRVADDFLAEHADLAYLGISGAGNTDGCEATWEIADFLYFQYLR